MMSYYRLFTCIYKRTHNKTKTKRITANSHHKSISQTS